MRRCRAPLGTRRHPTEIRVSGMDRVCHRRSLNTWHVVFAHPFVKLIAIRKSKRHSLVQPLRVDVEAIFASVRQRRAQGLAESVRRTLPSCGHRQPSSVSFATNSTAIRHFDCRDEFLARRPAKQKAACKTEVGASPSSDELWRQRNVWSTLKFAISAGRLICDLHTVE